MPFPRSLNVWLITLGATMILFHVLAHRDGGGWIAKGATRDTVVIEGHLVEWEWIHVAATARLVDPRHDVLQALSTQDAFRFIPGLLVGALRGPAGGIYGAAVAATLLTWGAATAVLTTAVRRMRLATVARDVALPLVATVILMSHGAGYVAFLGNVDAHQFGYAAAALWTGAWVLLRPDSGAAHDTSLWRCAAAGLTLCIAGYAMEIAYPLLLSGWLLFALGARRRDLSARAALQRGLVFTLCFGVPYFGFQLLMRQTLGPLLVPLNDPVRQLLAQLSALADLGVVSWVGGRLYGLAERWLAAFPLPVSALAGVGLVVLPRRWQLWALAMFLPMLVAVGATKLLVRTLYLAHPPIYVLAAGGAAWLAERTGARLTRSPRGPRAVLVALLFTVVVATNADLWGDYFLPTWWWRIQ